MKTWILLATLTLLCTSALAETYRVNPSKAKRLDAVMEQLQPGDVVIFERGTYRTDKPILLTGVNQVELRGESGAEIVLSDLDEAVIELENCNQVHLSGLKARHAQPAAEYQCEGAVIRVSNSSRVAVTDSTLNGCGAAGVYAVGTTELAVLRNTIFNNTYAAVWVYDSSGVVQGNKMYKNAADLVTGGTCSVTLVDNTIENNDGNDYSTTEFIRQMLDKK